MGVCGCDCLEHIYDWVWVGMIFMDRCAFLKYLGGWVWACMGGCGWVWLFKAHLWVGVPCTFLEYIYGWVWVFAIV